MQQTAHRLARTLAEQERRLAAYERGSQMSRTSVVTEDGNTLALPAALAAGANAADTVAVLAENAVETQFAIEDAQAVADGAQEAADAAQAAADAVAAEVATVPAQIAAAKAEILAEAGGGMTDEEREDLADAVALTAPGAITETLIADGAITTAKITAGSIVAGKIAAGAVNATAIAAEAVVAGKIAADAVLADNIKAGEITAAKLAAGTITAASGVIGSLDAAKITVGTMDGARITAGTVTAAKLSATAIDGKVITGSTFQTEATTARGIKISGAGLSAYSPAGVNTVSIDTATGALTAVGTFKTAATGARVEITKDPADGTTHLVRFVHDVTDPGMSSAFMYSNSNLEPVGTRSSKIGIVSGTKTDETGKYTAIDVGTSNLYLTAHANGANDAQIQMRAADGLVSIAGGAAGTEIVNRFQASAMRPVQGFGSGVFTTTGAGVSQFANAAAITFVAPASGMVKVTISGFLKAVADGSSTTLQFEVRTGATIKAGTVLYPSDANKSIAQYNVQYVKGDHAELVSGLTPGANYNAYVTMQAAAAGATCSNTSILVEPCL